MMMSAVRSRRLVHAAAVAVSAACLVAGCASPTPAGQAVPELRSALAQVDRAIVDHDYVQARALLYGLVRTTVMARDDGELDASQAGRVLAAAAGLLSALPQSEGRRMPPLDTPGLAPARDGDGGDQPAQPQGAAPLHGPDTTVETLLDEPGGSPTKPVGSADGPDEPEDAPVVPGDGPVAPEDSPGAPAEEPVDAGDPPDAPDETGDEPDEPEQDGNGNNGNGRGNSGQGNGNNGNGNGRGNGQGNGNGG